MALTWTFPRLIDSQIVTVALVHAFEKVAVTLFFCAPHPSMPQKLSMPLKLSATFRLAALEPPSKSYANRRKRS